MILVTCMKLSSKAGLRCSIKMWPTSTCASIETILGTLCAERSSSGNHLLPVSGNTWPQDPAGSKWSQHTAAVKGLLRQVAECRPCLKVPGEDVEANGPSPGKMHVLRKGCGCEPHGDTQNDAPSGPCKGLQDHVIECIENQDQQAPIQHCSTAQT